MEEVGLFIYEGKPSVYTQKLHAFRQNGRHSYFTPWLFIFGRHKKIKYLLLLLYIMASSLFLADTHTLFTLWLTQENKVLFTWLVFYDRHTNYLLYDFYSKSYLRYLASSIFTLTVHQVRNYLLLHILNIDDQDIFALSTCSILSSD